MYWVGADKDYIKPGLEIRQGEGGKKHEINFKLWMPPQNNCYKGNLAGFWQAWIREPDARQLFVFSADLNINQ